MGSLGFSTYRIMSFANRDNSTSSLPSWCLYFFFLSNCSDYNLLVVVCKFSLYMIILDLLKFLRIFASMSMRDLGLSVSFSRNVPVWFGG